MNRALRVLAACGAALFAALSLSGCGKEKEGRMEVTSIPRKAIVSVNVVSDLGGVSVSTTKNDVIRIEPTYRITAQGERRALIESSLLLSTDTAEEGLLTIYPRLDAAVVLGEEERVEMDLAVQVPAELGSVVVQAQQGDILLDGLRGIELLLVGSQGNITVKDTTIIGTSNIMGVMGNIDLRLKSIEGAESLNVSNDMGDIRLNVPKNASYAVTIEQLSQASSGWSQKGGKTGITLASKSGKVQFQK